MRLYPGHEVARSPCQGPKRGAGFRVGHRLDRFQQAFLVGHVTTVRGPAPDVSPIYVVVVLTPEPPPGAIRGFDPRRSRLRHRTSPRGVERRWRRGSSARECRVWLGRLTRGFYGYATPSTTNRYLH